MSTLFEGDLHAGLSGLELEDESFDLGDGLRLSKTYAHLMSPFLMAFAPAPPGGHHPAPWRAASGGFSFDVNAELLASKVSTGQESSLRKQLFFCFVLE